MNFPVNVSEVCSSLPKTLDNVLIVPPRTGSSDSTETPVLQTYFTVRQPYVVRALHWLKDHNTLYRDVEIEEVSDDASSSSQTVVNLLLEEIYKCQMLKFPISSTITMLLCINSSMYRVHLSAYIPVLMLNKWPFLGCIRMVLMGIKHHKIHP